MVNVTRDGMNFSVWADAGDAAWDRVLLFCVVPAGVVVELR